MAPPTTPSPPPFAAAGCMITLATLTVFYGAHLSARRKEPKEDDDVTEEDEDTDPAETIDLQCHHVAMMPIMSSISLLILFFFFKYVQWILIVWISITACAACFEMYRLTFYEYLRCSLNNSSMVAVILAGITFLTWATTGSFIAHDMLGCSICICCIAAIRFPSGKLATLCLCLLVLYDIFWVFYSEYFFHKNVMVNVATKSSPNPLQSLGENYGIKSLAALNPTIELPIKLMWPAVWTATANVRYIMLGLGDIVLPGFFVALALRCDMNQSLDASKHGQPILPITATAAATWSIYTGGFLTNTSSKLPCSDVASRSKKRLDLFNFAMCGYFLGLITAFTVGYVFQHAQPALIYLVPGVLLPVAGRAWQTDRLLEIWNGPFKREH